MTQFPLSFRTIWISDIHLGIPASQVQALIHFLDNTKSEMLYLVGDIIDGWQLKQRFYWPQKNNTVLHRLFRIARSGTKVFYIPGNHDEVMRSFAGRSLGGIEIATDYIHHTQQGERIWVVHGDVFDTIMQNARWLATIGDRLYVMLLVLNYLFNIVLRAFNLPYWSFSQSLKRLAKAIVALISNYEKNIQNECARRHCSGIICGHLHKAEARKMGGIDYYNDGDWVESITALVEHHDGRMEILDWAEIARVDRMALNPSLRTNLRQKL